MINVLSVLQQLCLKVNPDKVSISISYLIFEDRIVDQLKISLVLLVIKYIF